MAELTYTFDNVGPLSGFNPVLDRYSTGFGESVAAAIPTLPNTEGNLGNVSLQLIDTDEPYVAASFEGAYVTDASGQMPDLAPIVIFDDAAASGVGGAGVHVAFAGNLDQFIGLTDWSDRLSIKASGNDGDLTIDAGGGHDTVTSGRGDDWIYGGDQEDLLRGGAGDDTIDGGDDDDKLHGGRGNDELWGGSGDDTMQAGSGDDVMNGGEGDDHFRFGRQGTASADGGEGFDVAWVRGDAEDFTFDGTTWSDGEGNALTGVEYANLDGDDILITAASDLEAAAARLFQILNDEDPTQGELKDAFAFFEDDDATLSDFAEHLDDGTGEAVSGEAEIQDFVVDMAFNTFDGTTGFPEEGWVDAYVDGLIAAQGDTWVKSEIAADFAMQDAVIAAQSHIVVATEPEEPVVV